MILLLMRQRRRRPGASFPIVSRSIIPTWSKRCWFSRIPYAANKYWFFKTISFFKKNVFRLNRSKSLFRVTIYTWRIGNNRSRIVLFGNAFFFFFEFHSNLSGKTLTYIKKKKNAMKKIRDRLPTTIAVWSYEKTQ